MIDHRVMTIKETFFTRPPPLPVLSAAQQLDRFLNSIREKNALVVTGTLKESDELYRRIREATLRRGAQHR
jgi:hypothetical protein